MGLQMQQCCCLGVGLLERTIGVEHKPYRGCSRLQHSGKRRRTPSVCWKLPAGWPRPQHHGGPANQRSARGRFTLRSLSTGESTDAIVVDESPADERDIREACQRCVSALFLD
ncbi:unnamed protein product [Tetraodon nigroviridis]|uniref:(spotted green pufferfish) hypothetical protein n=1 Tax=Tetraodon nigroviridis TaxID=99883 RepID=Q4RM55_TETNG|nr:unnamed protein product [Tetraodon nigroviridis]